MINVNKVYIGQLTLVCGFCILKLLPPVDIMTNINLQRKKSWEM